MKKIFAVALTLGALVACSGGKNTSTSVVDSATLKNDSIATEVVEVYTGVIPAASAPGIEMTLKLYENGSYAQVSIAQEEGAEAVETYGTFEMHGDTLVLTPSEGDLVLRGLLGAESIQLLDANGNLPELPYALKLKK